MMKGIRVTWSEQDKSVTHYLTHDRAGVVVDTAFRVYQDAPGWELLVLCDDDRLRVVDHTTVTVPPPTDTPGPG